MNLCIECNLIKGRLNKKLNIYLCAKCSELDKYELIIKKYAKEKYLLKDIDFDNIIGYAGKCGRYDATFYKIIDIEKYVCQKNNIFIEELPTFLINKKEELLEKKKQREEKRETNRIRKEEKDNKKRTIRRTNLVTALKNAGLELRSDSLLCKNYIAGLINDEIDEVVKRMCQMKYLFEYCHMDECKQIAYENQRDELRAGYFPDCSVFDDAEYIALNKYSNGKYPSVFPWQQV